VTRNNDPPSLPHRGELTASDQVVGQVAGNSEVEESPGLFDAQPEPILQRDLRNFPRFDALIGVRAEASYPDRPSRTSSSVLRNG
jgi:hypothetical protein